MTTDKDPGRVVRSPVTPTEEGCVPGSQVDSERASVLPCGSCPWRRSTPPDGSTIPGYDWALVDESLQWVVAEVDQPDDGYSDGWFSVMACHLSRDGADRACVGYLAVEGVRNLHVRVAAIDGTVDLAGIQEACADVELYGSFREMRDAMAAAAGR